MAYRKEVLALFKAMGLEEPAGGPSGLTVHTPIDGSVLARVALSSGAQTGAAVMRANARFASWRDVPAPKRGELVRAFGEAVRRHKQALGRLITLETGKIVQEGLGEVQEVVDICEFAVGLSRQLYGLSIASERPEHKLLETWHPLGVVGVISAFNFPMAVFSWNAALALVCGNTLVWKPSEKAPLSAIALHGLANFSRETLAPFIDPEAQGPVPPPGLTAEIAAGGSPADSAIRLAKIARLLPATVAAPLLVRDAIVWAAAQGRSAVMASAIDSYDRIQAEDLRAVSEARVPLADSEQSRIISFRPSDGGAEHLAIVIGELDLTRPVLTRLHSECFTGDLLGSLRCDCGDQLRGAIQTIAKNGSGVLLYLAQEGRGIGLVNKLRAYRLQDYGFDTVDANEQLGFDDDERIYLPAFHILKKLGIARVRLLTNNPAKVGALARHGIEVTERVPHVVASNDHNRNYLATKAKRSGHLF